MTGLWSASFLSKIHTLIYLTSNRSRLTAAGANYGLHLLTKTANSDGTILDFGGGIHGHHGKINDMSFCGGGGQDSARYVATVSGVVNP
jgi:hypothetical protein